MNRKIDLNKIALKYHVVLHRIVSGDECCKANGESYYINASYCSGNEIWLGIYEDKELELISFFHEMGHKLDKTDWSIGADKTTTYKAEKNAWKIGYKLAKSYGISFSKKAKDWAAMQLETYNVMQKTLQ